MTIRTSLCRPTAPLLLLTALFCCLPGCSDGPAERLNGPVSAFDIRRFQAPGQPIAQSLDPGGRALIFLELTSAMNGAANDIDPDWTFTVTVKGPDGKQVPLLENPSLPTAWANDAGARFIGGFEAPVRGYFQIDITSPNCPARQAPMVLLPVN